MTDPRRRFGTAERAALYLAADGRCTTCGAELEPGWHADHIHPHTAGGPTDVINGQALCPPCNLKKGSAVTDLRRWQAEALDAFIAQDGDFLAVATPGAGKTTLAITAASRLIENGTVSRIIVVVPSAHLRVQWARAAAAAGVQLDHGFDNAQGALARDFDGVVITYQAMASAPHLYRRMCGNASTLVVLDEVHHCGEGEHLAWGRALATAFEPARRRLLLSGTPFRTRGERIPWVEYEEDEDGKLRCRPSFNYDYGTALLDGDVVRPVEFLALDGKVSWREAGVVREVGLVDAHSDDLSNALGTAYDPDGEWIDSVLRRADAELTRHRLQVPDAGGLVVAADQHKARLYALSLARITNEDPTLAISDEVGASKSITDFASASTRWIVAVQMVAEGVDIPRLAVGVYASRTRTEMFFRQVVGRFVRMRGAEDETTATILVPSIQPLLRYAQAIERTVEAALAEEEQRVRDQLNKSEAPEPMMFDLVEALGSTEAILHSTIASGVMLTDDELRRAQTLIDAMPNLPSSLTASTVAQILRAAGAGQSVGTVTVRAPVAAEPLTDVKDRLRRLIARKVGKLHKASGTPFQDIHVRLNSICGSTVPTSDVRGLERRVDLLNRWLREH